MKNYSDHSQEFKLMHAGEFAGISRRNIGIFAMWMTAVGIPETLQEFVVAVFVSGNWDDTEVDEISLKRMARAISPGADSDESLRRAYNRLKKNSPEFFRWQEKQKFVVIPREMIGHGAKSIAYYSFPHYKMVMKLFNLPREMNQKDIRKEVSKALKGFPLPKAQPRQRKQRKPESIALSIAKLVEELLSVTETPIMAGVHLSEAWRTSLGDEVVDALKKAL